MTHKYCYQRVLEITKKLPPEEQHYVLATLLHYEKVHAAGVVETRKKRRYYQKRAHEINQIEEGLRRQLNRRGNEVDELKNQILLIRGRYAKKAQQLWHQLAGAVKTARIYPEAVTDKRSLERLHALTDALGVLIQKEGLPLPLNGVAS